jgi:hypothetical protein
MFIVGYFSSGDAGRHSLTSASLTISQQNVQKKITPPARAGLTTGVAGGFAVVNFSPCA